VQLRVTIFRVGTRPEHSVTRIRELLEIPVKSLDAFYVVPKFTNTARPCGTVNAYSMPDIIVCTELLADLFEKQASGAVIPILLHEMGHWLLYLWGLPGYNNEDMADEFAAAFLAKESTELLDDLIKWLESQDSATEALIQLLNGGRHTISIQRARNMRAALSKPDELLARWGRLLGPFRRQPPR
jgi:Putative metallopeptidase